VKARYFQSLRNGGNDPDAERVYLWHIAKRSGHRIEAGIATDQWKLSLQDYLNSCANLLASMSSNGYDKNHPIPVDPDNELLGGAHRLACALVLGIESVPIERKHWKVWAPAWNEQWFKDNGMDEADLTRLREDWRKIRACPTS
jgi:hypothetical protein